MSVSSQSNTVSPSVSADGLPVDDSWRKNLGRSKISLASPRLESWWSGLLPENCPGYEQGKLHSLIIPNLETCSRREVLDYFDNTWTINELLFSSLIGEESFYRPPYHNLRHPLVFYYVHPAVLYVNKLRLAGLLNAPVNAYFESLFEIGVDEMSWDDMSKNTIEWPSVDDCRAYRGQVYALIRAIIENHDGLSDGHAAVDQKHPLWALFMGFEHERIHIETSSVLMRELPVHLLKTPEQWPDMAPSVDVGGKEGDRQVPAFPPEAGLDYPENQFVDVAACTVNLGKPLNWPTFGWDNEYGERSTVVGAFSAARFLVSNGEYWQFVNDKGYADADNWTALGWRWRSFRNVQWPTFWHYCGQAGSQQYRLRTCFENVPMPWSWPVVVNYHEAQAYCRWRSKKDGINLHLVTEAEHQAMRIAGAFDGADLNNLVAPRPFNINLRYGSESPVDANSELFPDLFGNVWQWCEDFFNPLAGFEVHKLYDDFSTPCFDGEHQMIVGGSFISSGDEATAWARFHFRPHFFQHAGIRLVSRG